MIRRRVTVSGHVQGVFFRDSVRRLAQERSVAGWIRNTGEGAVEAAFEGEPAAVEALIEFCRQGPERARVHGVEVSEAEPEGAEGFRIV